MKLRIAAAVAAGVVLIGIMAWPMAEPSEEIGAISYGDAVTLVILAFLTGLIGYFVSWPYGREIGILAVPSGLAIWAVRSRSVMALMQLNATVSQRQVILASLKWEPIFWLFVVAAGFAGVLLGQKIRSSLKTKQMQEKSKSNLDKYLKEVITLVGSVLVAQFCIRIFAQDVKIFDNNMGTVVAQPAVGQIVFAVSVSFGLAAFLFKKYLNTSYICPIIASVFITAYAASSYAKHLQYLVQYWPATFFSNAVVSILPIQMVAFGTLGSIAGYWMAVRSNYWREHDN